MKKWKNRLAAAFLMTAMAVCVVADITPASAAALTAKQYLSKMEKVSNKAKSYEVTRTVMAKVEQAGQSATTKTTTKQIIFQKPIRSKAVTTVEVSGDGVDQKAKSTVYMKETSKGKIYEYVSVDGSEYEEIDMTDMYQTSNDLDVSLYSDLKIVKRNVKVNKVNTVQISAKIQGADMAEAMLQLGGTDDSEDMGMDYDSIKPVKVMIWIDAKNYFPVKVTTNMAAFYNSYFKSMYEAMDAECDIKYSVAKSTTTYKNFNKATNFKFPKF